MNEYERENVERIINEIKELEKKKPLSDEQKAYELYKKLGDIYKYKVSYLYADERSYDEIIKKIKIYREGTTEDGEAICIDMNATYVEALRMLGIKAHISFLEQGELAHSDVCFKSKDGKWYFANMTADIMNIKTGMRIRNFGISQKRIEEKLFNFGPDKIDRMKEENEGKEFTEIPKEQLEEWDKESGYSYNGIYTNEALKMLANDMLDEELCKKYFKTDNIYDLVQKKFEFIMDKIEIANVHRRKPIGDAEAINYYIKIIIKAFSPKERQLLDYIHGFIEEDELRKARDIFVIKKRQENIYYLYNPLKQIYERIEKEELLKQPIKYNNIQKQRIEPIYMAIDKLEMKFYKKDLDMR